MITDNLYLRKSIKLNNYAQDYIHNSYDINPQQFRRDVFHSLTIIFLMIVAIRIGISSSIIYFLIAAIAIRSPIWAIKALILSYLFTSLTPAITNDFIPVEYRDGIINFGEGRNIIGRYLVLLGAAIGIMRFRKRTASFPVYLTGFTFFSLIIIFNSLLISYEPMISIFKASYLLTGIFLVLYSFHYMVDTEKFLSWIAAFFAVVILMGMPLVFSDQGYIVNGRGFQGILIHPQTIGVIAGILAVFFLNLILENRNLSRGVSLFIVLSLFSSLATLYLSQSRTGVLAFAFGMAFSFPKILLHQSTAFKAVICILIVFIGATLLIISDETIGNKIQTFILKGDADQIEVDVLWRLSRGDLIQASYLNYQKNPIFGTGFALPSNAQNLNIIRDPIFNIPVSASVEKGFLATAIMEELGIIGCIAALIFLFSILSWGQIKANACGIGILTAALASNIGEATLLSFGGLGTIIWVFIGLGLNLVSR